MRAGHARLRHHHGVVRAVIASIAIHVIALIALWPDAATSERAATSTTVARIEPAPVDEPREIVVEIVDNDSGGGGAGASQARAVRAAPRRAVDAWQSVSIAMDAPAAAGAGGSGGGNGHGTGWGLGDGNGGGVRIPDDVPVPPAPPPVEAPRISKARPAKLIYPTRDREVEDEADLFIARITVDSAGDVVGAHMVKTRPGARGDQAANAIWSFRYLPALDEDGRAITSTFEQPFQIR